MTIRKRLIKPKAPALPPIARRQPSRILDYPWPFPMSGDPQRGLVRNVQAPPKAPKQGKKTK